MWLAGVFELLFILLGVAGIVVYVWAFRTIFRKAGFPGWWALLMLLPTVNFVMLLVLAFSQWPTHAAPGRQASI